MSHWTHITACFSIDTGITEPKMKLRKIVKGFLENAPKITGSERDADIFINIQGGYNWTISHDCTHCKHMDEFKTLGYCEVPKNHDCSANYQSCIVISIQGDLRDRTKNETQKEVDDFIKYISKEYEIRDYSLNIESE